MTDSFEQISAHNEELARDIVERASARGVTVSTAESLTAGMIASTIADIPGASAVLRGGAVTYCDEIKHRVLGVEQETLDRFSAVSHQTAREMAEKFGVDEEKAALAGLLHDCAKCMPLSQMTKAAKNEKLDPVMKESKALMHAVAGAHVAQDVYDVHDPEVLGAIRWHTTGHANMTKLEKIVYLADMIEPNRKPYPGLEALRKLCMTDLDEAMHMALLMSLDHVREQGKPLHPDTMAALAEYEPGLV